MEPRITADAQRINDYIRRISCEDFTARTFRTWAGTVLASLALREFETFESPTEAKRNLARAVETVATQLGNTPAVPSGRPSICSPIRNSNPPDAMRTACGTKRSGSSGSWPPSSSPGSGSSMWR